MEEKMKFKKLLLLIFLVLLVSNCSKKSSNCDISDQNGVIVYSNKTNDNVVSINIVKEKEFFCDSISVIASFDVDDQGNFYVLDGKKMVFNKLDGNGKLLKIFGKRGTGPGEYGAVGDFILIKDKIYVPDMMTKKIVVFSSNGDFLKFIGNIASIPTGVQVINRNQMIGYCVLPTFKSGGMYIKSSLSILDSNFAEQKVLLSKEILLNPQKMFDNDNESPIYTSFKNNVVLATNSENKYEISVLDTNGKLIKKILKSFKKINYTKNEIEQFQKKIDDKLKGQMPAGSIKFSKISKLAISWLGFDKYNRLWVQSAREENITKQGAKSMDIFDENGVLLGKADIEIDRNIKFGNNKIYSLDNNKIIVWNY